TGLRPQGHAMGARLKDRSGLVETNVPVRADPENLHVDAAGARDRLLVAFALRFGVGHVARQKVGLRRWQVHAAEQGRLPKAARAARKRRWYAEELVEIERRHTAELEIPALRQRTQLLVKTNWSASRRQAEDEIRLDANGVSDVPRQRARGSSIVGVYMQSGFDDFAHQSRL